MVSQKANKQQVLEKIAEIQPLIEDVKDAVGVLNDAKDELEDSLRPLSKALCGNEFILEADTFDFDEIEGKDTAKKLIEEYLNWELDEEEG